MSDEDLDPRYFVQRGRRPLWRRVRKSEGATWQPIDRYDLEHADKGIICKVTCHRRIAYKDIFITYEIRPPRVGDVFRLWWCTNCDGLLREDNVTDMMIAYELRAIEQGEENEEQRTDYETPGI
jgi:hypothetical protein